MIYEEWRISFQSGEQAARSAYAMWQEAESEIVGLRRSLNAKLADHIHGTPCAQIRWHQEREALEAERDAVKRANKELGSIIYDQSQQIIEQQDRLKTADAYLIAAAPELYEALSNFVMMSMGDPETLRIAREAMAKARGEEQ